MCGAWTSAWMMITDASQGTQNSNKKLLVTSSKGHRYESGARSYERGAPGLTTGAGGRHSSFSFGRCNWWV